MTSSPAVGAGLTGLASDWAPWVTEESSHEGEAAQLVIEAPGVLSKISWGWSRDDLAFAWGRDRSYAELRGKKGALEVALQLWIQRTLFETGGLMIHGAGGLYRGEGWLIAGPSGAGKSTAARVAGFDQVFSDEAVALTPPEAEGEGWRIWGTPFWSEGRSLPLNSGSAPLNWLIFPQKGAPLRFTPTPPADSARRVLRAVFAYRWEVPTEPGLFERSCALCETIHAGILTVSRFGPWIDEARALVREGSILSES
ncbi:MAG: hypothetical protein VYD19_04475 [Myxococcota bacterium]|nr:hypothetical protein [Myxococcota bacterium]